MFFKTQVFQNVRQVTKIPISQTLTAFTPTKLTHAGTIIGPKIPAGVRRGNEKVRVENVLLVHLDF